MTKSFLASFPYGWIFNNGAEPIYRHKRSDLFVWIFHYVLTSRERKIFCFAFFSCKNDGNDEVNRTQIK